MAASILVLSGGHGTVAAVMLLGGSDSNCCHLRCSALLSCFAHCGSPQMGFQQGRWATSPDAPSRLPYKRCWAALDLLCLLKGPCPYKTCTATTIWVVQSGRQGLLTCRKGTERSWACCCRTADQHPVSVWPALHPAHPCRAAPACHLYAVRGHSPSMVSKAAGLSCTLAPVRVHSRSLLLGVFPHGAVPGQPGQAFMPLLIL